MSSVDRSPKPAKVMVSGFDPTVRTVKHLCGGCDTTITSAGYSKATRHDVVTHKCTGCGAGNLACCNSSGSGVATKGMEKKFEIAPLR